MNNQKKQPQTWDELLDAGYVRELTEEEVALFKFRTERNEKPLPSVDEMMNAGHTSELEMRKRLGLKV